MNIQKLIESDMSSKEVASSLVSESVEFNSLTRSQTKMYLRESAEETEDSFGVMTNIPIEGNELFESRVTNVVYGRTVRDKPFVRMISNRGSMYELLEVKSLNQARQEAQALATSKIINLNDINAKEVK